MFDSIRSFLRGDDLLRPYVPPATRAVAGDLAGRPWSTGRPASWLATDSSTLIKDAWKKLTVVFACATLLGDAVAESPLRVYREVDGEPREDPGHPVRAILAEPNPRYSEAEFIALLVGIMGLTGYVVLEKVRSGAGLPVELWPLRPTCLKVQLRDHSAPGWEYRVPGHPKRILEPEDVIVITYRDDLDLAWTGISPAQVAAREVGIDNSLTDFLKSVLDAGGIPPFVLTHPDPIYDPSVIDSIQTRWRQDYGGAAKWHKLPVIHGGFTPEKIGMDLNEMAYPDLRAMDELRICQAYRVPPHLVFARSAVENGGLTTTEQGEAMRMLQHYAATPLRNRIDGALTRGLLREYTDDPLVTLEFDISDVRGMQEDATKLHERVRADVAAGIIMRSEARALFGHPVTPADEVYLLPFNVIEVPAGQTATRARATTIVRERPPAALPSGRRYRDLRSLSPADFERRARVVTVNRKAQRALSEILARKLRNFWKEQGERLRPMLTEERSRRDVAEIDWADEEDRLREVLNRFYDEAGNRAFADTAKLFDLDDLTWDLGNPNVSRILRQLGDHIVEISDETRANVQDVIADALDEGVTLQELGERLTGLFEETYRGRAETVGRTESMHAYNRASVLSYEESKQVDEAELADNPEHTTDPGSDGLTCAERDGLVVPLAEVQRHIDGEHPNGSLAVIPILAKTLGEE